MNSLKQEIPVSTSFKSYDILTKNNHRLMWYDTGFYSISLTADFDKTHEFFASKVLSRVIGINIHTDWDLGFLKNSTKRKYTEFSESNYKKLITRNAELFLLDDKLCNTVRNRKELYHGAISRFNADDISYFLSFNWAQRPKIVERRTKELEEHFKFSFQWVTSPETLNTIIKALNNEEINELNLTLDNLDFYE